MTITLLDGRQVDSGNVFFDDIDYSFKLGGSGENITALIRAADKRTFNGFDQTKYNDILYAQNYFRIHGTYPDAVGSTSVWANFANQILTDPLAAPLDSLNATVSQALGSSGVQKILIFAGLALVALIVLKAE